MANFAHASGSGSQVVDLPLPSPAFWEFVSGQIWAYQVRAYFNGFFMGALNDPGNPPPGEFDYHAGAWLGGSMTGGGTLRLEIELKPGYPATQWGVGVGAANFSSGAVYPVWNDAAPSWWADARGGLWYPFKAGVTAHPGYYSVGELDFGTSDIGVYDRYDAPVTVPDVPVTRTVNIAPTGTNFTGVPNQPTGTNYQITWDGNQPDISDGADIPISVWRLQQSGSTNGNPTYTSVGPIGDFSMYQDIDLFDGRNTAPDPGDPTGLSTIYSGEFDVLLFGAPPTKRGFGTGLQGVLKMWTGAGWEEISGGGQGTPFSVANKGLKIEAGNYWYKAIDYYNAVIGQYRTGISSWHEGFVRGTGSSEGDFIYSLTGAVEKPLFISDGSTWRPCGYFRPPDISYELDGVITGAKDTYIAGQSDPTAGAGYTGPTAQTEASPDTTFAPNPGSGGDGTAPTGGDTAATGTLGDIYNPWSSYSISGTWQDHMSYSLGGIDYPLGYGTNLAAPATGTLHTSGGSGEFTTGWVGSAGRRSILYLDTPVHRQNPVLDQNEGSGDMVAIVFQHQSAFGTNGKHYAKGDYCGVSGASANGSNYGGEVHLHVHGLNASGQRVNFLNFI